MKMDERSQKPVGIDPRLAGALMLYAKRLEDALRAYYNQHRATGCECDLCEDAERAFISFSKKAEKQKPGK
jgi:hypothetical protein